jgi:formylglycine-generating enzyme required for sulfatase activity
MHGNVYEWCQDRYGQYPLGPVTDPKGPSSGEYRVLRGGSWDSEARDVRSASRHRLTPGYRYGHEGFRVARDL